MDSNTETVAVEAGAKRFGYLVLRLCRDNAFSADVLVAKRKGVRSAVTCAATCAASLTVLLPLALLLAPLAMAQERSQPVLVELFTSEGCSSCPPADTLLAETVRNQPNIIALSEHVTYWNSLGWKDPFSSDESTERQSAYAQRWGVGSYTPQMVVNGARQFVGSDQGALRSALASQEQTPLAASLAISILDNGKPGEISAAVQLQAAAAAGRLIAVLVQDHGRRQVGSGENSGRTLNHVDIARDFRELGRIRSNRGFSGNVAFKLPAGGQPSDYHIVAFLQQATGGKVWAAASTGKP